MSAAALVAYAEAARNLSGNPGSTHAFGRMARECLEDARGCVYEALNFTDGRLLWTSGGTEANNLVLQSAISRKMRVLVARNVHPSLWYATGASPERVGALPLDREGRIDRSYLLREVKGAEPVLICVSHACNETGVLQPVAELAEMCRRGGHLLHIDATQTVGHLPLDLSSISAHFLSFSAHKFGGPRGVGGLLVREAPLLEGQLFGGSQEWGLRAGTENVPGALATAAALEAALETLPTEVPRLRELASGLVREVKASIPGALLNSDLEAGLPGLVSFCFPGTSGHELVLELAGHGYAVSAGSACHAGSVFPSRAILSMGRTEKEALGALRVSLGGASTKSAVSEFAETLLSILR